jgi:hypothetical protein
MRLRRYHVLPLASCLIVSACGGGDTPDAQPGDAATADASDLSCYVARGTMEEAGDRPSPLQQTSFSFPGGEGLLCYGAPSARGREVMGALVPWEQPWRIGANEPTTIHLDAPATVGGVALEPGSYSLYAVPTETEWEFFVNPNWERWGIPIDASVRTTELASFTATPESTDTMVETLVYTWEPAADGGGALVLEWENTRVRIPVGAGAE